MPDAGLSTLDYLKSRLLPEAEQEETTWDAALGMLGKAIAERMQIYCNRRFARAVDEVDEFPARTLAVTLRRYPVEEIESIQIREWNGTPSALNTGHACDMESGLIEFSRPPGGRTQRIMVTYTGGYWLDDGGEMPAGARPLPDDLLEAFVAEVQWHAETRGLFGAAGLRPAKEAGERRIANGLSEECGEALRPYRRFSGE